MVLLYVVFFMIFVEGSVRFILSNSKLSKRLMDYHEEDYWWRNRWITKHQNSGTDTSYKTDVFDRSKGWIAKPNLRNIEFFDHKVLNTNSKGLRGIKDYPYGKNRSQYRILLLGDSFTFGDEVSDNETYARYLQEMLPDVEVLNMGMHGYGHDQMLIFLEEEGIKYEPDMVIMGFIGADMSRNLLHFRDYAKPWFVLDDGGLKVKGTPVPSPEEFLEWDWVRPRAFDLLPIVRGKFMESYGAPEREKAKKDIATALLTEIITITDRIHAVPIFAYLPTQKEITDRPGLTPGESFMFSMCQANTKVKCFSTRKAFAEKIAKGWNSASFMMKWHWGPEGHLIVAGAIKRYLVDEGYVVLP